MLVKSNYVILYISIIHNFVLKDLGYFRNFRWKNIIKNMIVSTIFLKKIGFYFVTKIYN